VREHSRRWTRRLKGNTRQSAGLVSIETSRTSAAIKQSSRTMRERATLDRMPTDRLVLRAARRRAAHGVSASERSDRTHRRAVDPTVGHRVFAREARERLGALAAPLKSMIFLPLPLVFKRLPRPVVPLFRFST